mmetsp:Transcript_34321/g.76766  ORF Transcript_34321/g.76766 Transcript_34321/m.76766 type:complete len:767 (+) Transcript_34321:2-2302(+)
MGAVIFNTARYAELRVDKQIYDFAVQSGKIMGTKPLMNGFFKRFSHLEFVDVQAIQKSQKDAPCDQGISHFATGQKPWATTPRLCIDAYRSQCGTWAYCMWWTHRKAFDAELSGKGSSAAPPQVEAPAEIPEDVAEEQPEVPPEVRQLAHSDEGQTREVVEPSEEESEPEDEKLDDETPKTAMTLRITPREKVNVAFLYQGKELMKSLLISMSSVCRTSVASLVKMVVLHVMFKPSDAGELDAFKTAWAEDATSRLSHCTLEAFAYEDRSDFDWQVFRTLSKEEDYRLWQSLNLPTELGRREVGIALVMDIGPVMLQEAAAVLAVTRCESWIIQDVTRLACLNKNWMSDANFVVDTNKYYDINADQDAHDYVRMRLDRHLPPIAEQLLHRYFTEKHRIFRTCSMPSELPREFSVATTTCDKGMVTWRPGKRPWRHALVTNCSMEQCTQWAKCQWGKYAEKKEPQIGDLSRDDYRKYYDWYTRISTPDPTKCDLKFMSSKLYLWNMVPSLDYDLLEHFLDHYRSLGVDLTARTHILIHKKDEQSLQEMLRVLESFGVKNINVTDSYKSREKKAAVNLWLASLPEDSWALYPDSDEFFSFPCSMQGLIDDGIDAFRGEMMERLGEGYILPALRPLPKRISEQYSISCPYRKNLMQGNWANKYMLIKARDAEGKVRRFKDSHRIKGLNSGGDEGKFNGFYLGPIPHYYFIGRGACDKLDYKQKLYTKGIPAAIYQKANRLIVCKDGVSRLSETVKHEMAAKCVSMEVDC